MAANYCAGVGLITKCFYSSPIKSYISGVLLVFSVGAAQEWQNILVSRLKAQSKFCPLARACGIKLTARTNIRHVDCRKLVKADASLTCKMTQEVHYFQNLFIFRRRNLKEERGFLLGLFYPRQHCLDTSGTNHPVTRGHIPEERIP
jgi:hypothetical protein